MRAGSGRQSDAHRGTERARGRIESSDGFRGRSNGRFERTIRTDDSNDRFTNPARARSTFHSLKRSSASTDGRADDDDDDDAGDDDACVV